MMFAHKRAVCLTTLFLFLVAPFLFAEKPEVQKGAEQIRLIKKDISKPLREIPPAPRPSGVKFIRQNHKFIENLPFQQDGALQTSATPSLDAPALSGQFEAIGEGIAGYSVCCVPPDTNGDVGPNHYVQTVNLDYAVFNKTTGARLLGPVPTNTIWNGFGGPCQANNDGDPIVVYDQFSDRWIISQFVAVAPYQECVAVSTSGDPTGSYHRFAYDFGTNFPDYPKMGIWPTEDAYFITYNMFAGGAAFIGSRVCAYQRSKLMAGQANTAQCFNPSSSHHSFLPADLDGNTLPASGTDGYMINRFQSTLVSWRANIDWANSLNSTLTGPTTVSGVSAYTTACNGGGACIPQLGTTRTLDSLGDRLMFRAAYRVLSGNQALVVNHSVAAAGTTGVRWYELRPNGTGLSVFQQGTFTPDSTHRWMGSVGMDSAGNIAMGYSASSSAINPGIRYTGRLVSDAAGTMQAEATIINGTGSQTTHARWGDYSSINIDPTDDCTFFYTTEYLTQTGVFNWHTRVARFKFANCGGGGNQPPVAGFTFSCTGLTCNFTDTSTDDVGIVTRAWNFGDGGTSSQTNPSHTYAAGGTYPVTLTVTDGGGLSDSDTQNVTVSAGGAFTLSTTGYKVKGVQHADLTWTGATGANVDVFRNNVKIVTTANDGAHTDNIGAKGKGTYTYRVCNAGTSTCSNNSTVVF